MPGKYDGLFVEYCTAMYVKRKKMKNLQRNTCFAILPTGKYTSLLRMKKKEKNQFCYLKILANFEA